MQKTYLILNNKLTWEGVRYLKLMNIYYKDDKTCKMNKNVIGKNNQKKNKSNF